MDLRRIRFLLVEDNREMAVIIRALLGSWGGTDVRMAESIEAALQWLGQESFDIAIIDKKLADGSGLDLVRKIRRSPLAFLPIMLVTGHASAASVAEARDSGVNEFLAKPFTAKRLYERLHRMIYEPLPFITTDEYVGPDRRRRAEEYLGEDRRRD